MLRTPYASIARSFNLALVAVSLLTALSACAGANTQASLAASCQAYASGLASAALYRDEMSVSQISSIESVRSALNPICMNLDTISPEDEALALRTLRDQLRVLNAVQTEVAQ